MKGGSSMTTEFKPGLYRHTKTGGMYTAIGLVTHHETRQPMVLYVSHKYGGSNVRPLDGWPGDPDGWRDQVEIPGERQGDMHTIEQVPRFTFIGDLPSDTPITERG